MSLVTACMKLVDIMFTEINQAQKKQKNLHSHLHTVYNTSLQKQKAEWWLPEPWDMGSGELLVKE